MYLHLGKDVLVRAKDVIGIFDLETSTISQITRQYLSQAEKTGRVVNVSMEMPKTFVVCCGEDGAVTVYISQISSATLRKRTRFLEGISLGEAGKG